MSHVARHDPWISRVYARSCRTDGPIPHLARHDHWIRGCRPRATTRSRPRSLRATVMSCEGVYVAPGATRSLDFARLCALMSCEGVYVAPGRDTTTGFRASMRAHVVRGGGCRTSRDTTARSAPRPLPTRAHVARRRPHRTSCDTQPAEVSRLLLVICVVFFSSAELGEGRWARASARGRQCDDDGERKREHRGAARATLRCEGEQVEPAEPGESAGANTATRMPSPSDPQLRVDGALS
jgi:hypothetical protein